jgi:hypothetical protein
VVCDQAEAHIHSGCLGFEAEIDVPDQGYFGLYRLCIHADVKVRLWAQETVRRWGPIGAIQAERWRIRVMLDKWILAIQASMLRAQPTSEADAGVPTIALWSGLGCVLPLIDGDYLRANLDSELKLLFDVIVNAGLDNMQQGGDQIDVFTYALRCLKTLLAQLGFRVWLHAAYKPRYVLQVLQTVVAVSKREAIQTESLKLLKDTLLSLSIAASEYRQLQSELLQFLFVKLRALAVASDLLCTIGMQVGFGIIEKAYQQPGQEPVDCCDLWAPSLVGCCTSSGLHRSIAVPAVQLLVSILQFDATNLHALCNREEGRVKDSGAQMATGLWHQLLQGSTCPSKLPDEVHRALIESHIAFAFTLASNEMSDAARQRLSDYRVCISAYLNRCGLAASTKDWCAQWSQDADLITGLLSFVLDADAAIHEAAQKLLCSWSDHGSSADAMTSIITSQPLKSALAMQTVLISMRSHPQLQQRSSSVSRAFFWMQKLLPSLRAASRDLVAQDAESSRQPATDVLYVLWGLIQEILLNADESSSSGSQMLIAAALKLFKAEWPYLARLHFEGADPVGAEPLDLASDHSRWLPCFLAWTKSTDAVIQKHFKQV